MCIKNRVSDTSSGSIHVKYAADKKYKPTAAYDALVASSSAGAAPAAPALAATSRNVELHNAAQTTVVVSSSSSSYSAATSERHRRLLYATAKAERELAEARVRETRAELELGTSSIAGSVGRLNDVRSDGGNSVHARRRDDETAPPNDGDEAANEQPTSDRGNHYDQQVAVRGLERGTPPVVCGAVASQEGQPTGSNPPAGALGLARGEPPSESTPPTETATSSTTYVLQQNILNEGCNFGTAIAYSRQDTSIDVE